MGPMLPFGKGSGVWALFCMGFTGLIRIPSSGPILGNHGMAWNSRSCPGTRIVASLGLQCPKVVGVRGPSLVQSWKF